ncbi:hypothetical protein MATL_G00038410 [Megalops atlanticus]|uniref:N-acetyltransferase ESCO1 n=1 Tax=Megalops atlanticus TaxID=7932 RepID=A0A9D3TDJ5_MEGAT|nr:hypothetical protein MATL_G00038410 [Megalops atlanticus]
MPTRKRRVVSCESQVKRRKLEQKAVVDLLPKRNVMASVKSTKLQKGAATQKRVVVAPRARKKPPAPPKDAKKPAKPSRHSARMKVAQKAAIQCRSKPAFSTAKGEYTDAPRSHVRKRAVPSRPALKKAVSTQLSDNTNTSLRKTQDTRVRKTTGRVPSGSLSSRGSVSMGEDRNRRGFQRCRDEDTSSRMLHNRKTPSSGLRGKKRVRENIESPTEMNKTQDGLIYVEKFINLDSIQADHNYGRLRESPSCNVHMKSKKGPKCQGTLKSKHEDALSRKRSKIAPEEQSDILSDPQDKGNTCREARQSVKGNSSPPMEAFFKVIKESNLYGPSLIGKGDSSVSEMQGVNRHFTPGILEDLKKDTKTCGEMENLQSTPDLQTALTEEHVNMGNSALSVEIVETEFYNPLIQNECDLIAHSESDDKSSLKLKVLEGEPKVNMKIYNQPYIDVYTQKGQTHTLPQEITSVSVKTNMFDLVKAESKPKTEDSLVPPKKQEMNPQARTKARLAALAEEKAAAAKKAAVKQLNLLALCEEIAEDIASDTVELKGEELDIEAAKLSNQKAPQPESKEEHDSIPAPSVLDDPCSLDHPVNAQTVDMVKAEEPKKRFFLSQISVPLKSNEKKLSRFQRLRQTELQREKLTWTRVKKFKTDQANQRLSTDEEQGLKVSLDPTPLSPTPSQATASRKETKNTGSENKKPLPDFAPPMPNGITVQKPRPVVEYKSYAPRPKYSPDDFELDGVDDEPKPILAKPMAEKTDVLPNPKHVKDEGCMESACSSPATRVPPIVTPDKQSCYQKAFGCSMKLSTQAEPENKAPQENTSSQCAVFPGSPPSGCSNSPGSDTRVHKEVRRSKETDKGAQQTTMDAGQKHFGAVTCSVCGMLYSAANPEDESQHLLFHNQFISAVRYVGWKKERILGEYPDGKIILVLPDDPKYALKKVEEIREMVDNDLGFQQVETKCPSQTKTFLFISNDKKVAGCLIAEHIQEGFRVIEEATPEGSEGEKVMFERQRAWCCSTTPEPALCGISRIWVFSMMRRRGIASRMIECLRNNFIYGSHLSKEEIAFSDPTPDGKLFATHYCGTSQFLVYNFVSGTRSAGPSQM